MNTQHVVSDNAGREEPILEPELPIVDAHHHLWLLPDAALQAVEAMNCVAGRAFLPPRREQARYLFDELMKDLDSGHNVRASVYVEAYSMYRSGGPDALKSVGEIEFANGVAAMAASGAFGDVKACAAIVGGVDLRLGEAVEEVLSAQARAGGDRYRGVRSAATMYDPDPSILGRGVGAPEVLLDREFRAGFKFLQPMGLCFDASILEPQLPELIDLARAFPETQIVLDHLGVPLGVAGYAGRRQERFQRWREHIRVLATCANVSVKLGGLGMPMPGFDSFARVPPASSVELAAEWKPYVESCIEVFGVDRCMFESNFPVDARTCSYPVLWNAFKRLTAGASKEEKTALFSGTATRIYRLDL